MRQIARVHVAGWLETYAGLVPQRIIERFAVFDRRAAEWEVRLQMNDVDRLVYVAEDAGVVHGFMWTAPPDVPTQSRVAGFDDHVYALYVLAANHMQGTGRGLVGLAAQTLTARGHRSLSLDVLAANPARGFYEHLGAEYLSTIALHDDADTWEQCTYGWTDITALCTIA